MFFFPSYRNPGCCQNFISDTADSFLAQLIFLRRTNRLISDSGSDNLGGGSIVVISGNW